MITGHMFLNMTLCIIDWKVKQDDQWFYKFWNRLHVILLVDMSYLNSIVAD